MLFSSQALEASKFVMDWEKYLDKDTNVIQIIPRSREFSVEKLKLLIKRDEHFRVVIGNDINVTFDKIGLLRKLNSKYNHHHVFV